MRKGRNHKIKEINTDKEMPCTVCMRGPTIETSSWEGAHFLTDTETPGGGGGGGACKGIPCSQFKHQEN